MQSILYALLPIFLLIALGYFFKRISFPDASFWEYVDKFTYYVLFPSLLVYKLSTANLEGVDGFAFVSSALITLAVITVILVVLNSFAFLFKGACFTSVYQGATRFNTYVFLALVDALYGDGGLILAAFLITFMIPTLNVCCITIFAFYTNNEKVNLKAVVLSIVKNPLILACLFGAGVNYFDISLGLSIEKTLSILSSAALPLGLLSVGVGLQLTHIKEAKMELFVSLFFKLAIFPMVIFFVAKALGIDGLSLMILVLFGAMPTASSAYILARQLGGDVKLMASIITLQTLLSIVTISVILNVITP